MPGITNLILAIIMIESGGNDLAIGDNGKAFGCMQIHQCVIDDVNRIKRTSYTIQDAYNREKSIEIFKIYTDHYAFNFESKARVWNGGPRGMDKSQTINYWKKVNYVIQKGN